MTDQSKIYSIGLKGSWRHYALVDLQPDLFHGVQCLKGTARSAKEQPWLTGKAVYIPVAAIAAITEFDSWDDFLAARKLADGAQENCASASPVAKRIKKGPKSKKRR